MDPSVKFTIKHVDGSICRHKKTWPFYNRKPPKDYELPDLSDTDVTKTTQTKSQQSQNYNLHSSKPNSSEDIAVVDINSCLSDHNNTLEAGHLVTTEKQVSQDNAGVSGIDGNTETKSQEHPENTLVNENDWSNISNLQMTSVTTQSNLVNIENTKTHQIQPKLMNR